MRAPIRITIHKQPISVIVKKPMPVNIALPNNIGHDFLTGDGLTLTDGDGIPIYGDWSYDRILVIVKKQKPVSVTIRS